MAKGRKRIEIDWAEFDKLCAMQATLEEIALWFECSMDTIERAVKREFRVSFAEQYQRKSVKGRIGIRRQMMQMALKGDRNSVPIIIYLDKKYLGGLPAGYQDGDGIQVNVQNNNLVTTGARLGAASGDLSSVPTVELVKLLIAKGECNAVQIKSPSGLDVRQPSADGEAVRVGDTEPIEFAGLQQLPDDPSAVGPEHAEAEKV